MTRRRPYITKPGAYDGVPMAIYHSDCTPTPALNASGAWHIENECPAYYWERSPMNPERIEEHRRDFDIGHASHLLVLEPKEFDRRVARINAPDYRALDAQQARRLYRDAGQIPLLAHEYEMVIDMRKALRRDPVAKHAFRGGVAERSYFWIDAETGIWCKARPDYSVPRRWYITDWKTSESAKPERFQRSIERLGYHLRAAWYADGVEAIAGQRPKTAYFIVQATERPHLITTVPLDDESFQWGRLIAQRARRIFAQCLATKSWPGYSVGGSGQPVVTVGLSRWAKLQLQDRLDRGEFAPPIPEAAE